MEESVISKMINTNFIPYKTKLPIELSNILDKFNNGDRSTFDFEIKLDYDLKASIDSLLLLNENEVTIAFECKNNKAIWLLALEDSFSSNLVLNDIKEMMKLTPVIIHKTFYNEKRELVKQESYKINNIEEIYIVSNPEEQSHIFLVAELNVDLMKHISIDNQRG